MEQMQFLCDRSIFSLQNIQKRKLWIELLLYIISNMFPHSHRSWRSLLSYPIKCNTVSIPKHHVGVEIITIFGLNHSQVPLIKWKNSRQNLVLNNYSAKNLHYSAFDIVVREEYKECNYTIHESIVAFQRIQISILSWDPRMDYDLLQELWSGKL